MRTHILHMYGRGSYVKLLMKREVPESLRLPQMSVLDIDRSTHGRQSIIDGEREGGYKFFKVRYFHRACRRRVLGSRSLHIYIPNIPYTHTSFVTGTPIPSGVRHLVASLNAPRCSDIPTQNELDACILYASGRYVSRIWTKIKSERISTLLSFKHGLPPWRVSRTKDVSLETHNLVLVGTRSVFVSCFLAVNIFLAVFARAYSGAD